jgi:hypothetical protein
MKLKPISKSFIWSNVFDILTTIFGINQGCTELNIIVIKYGWTIASISKFLVIIFVIYFLEKTKTYWFSWAIPAIVWLFVGWNISNIVLIMLDKIIYVW